MDHFIHGNSGDDSGLCVWFPKHSLFHIAHDMPFEVHLILQLIQLMKISLSPRTQDDERERWCLRCVSCSALLVKMNTKPQGDVRVMGAQDLRVCDTNSSRCDVKRA